MFIHIIFRYIFGETFLSSVECGHYNKLISFVGAVMVKSKDLN